MARGTPNERLACEQCHAAQPADRSATDACVACGGVVRPEARCPWCLAFGPAVRFCRECGAELPPAAHFGAARMLKAGGVDRFAIAERVRQLDDDYVADLDRRFDVRWGAARAVVERLAWLTAFTVRGPRILDQATTQWLETLPLEGPEPPPVPPVSLPPAPATPWTLRGPDRQAVAAAIQAAQDGCDDPTVRVLAAVAAVHCTALDRTLVRGLTVGPPEGLVGDDWALAVMRLWLLPATWPRFDVRFDMGVGEWQSKVSRNVADRLATLVTDADTRVATLAAIGRVALGDRDRSVWDAAAVALDTGDDEVRALAALAFGRQRRDWPRGVDTVLAELASDGPGPVSLAAVDRLLAAGQFPPQARGCVTACLEDQDPAVVLEGLARLRHRRDPPTGFAEPCAALLDARHPTEVRIAAASAIAKASDPTEDGLRRLLEMARAESDPELAREALRAASEHVTDRPWIAEAALNLMGRHDDGRTMWLDSRLKDWARDGALPLAALIGTFDDPDPERRRAMLRIARGPARGGDPELLAAALRMFLTDTDTECRDAAIWVQRDAWNADRNRKKTDVLDAAFATRAVGSAPMFWQLVTDLLRSGATRECAVGEHVEWIAQAATDDLLAPLADEPAIAATLVAALMAAAADPDVRTYPRAKFVQLAGRVASLVPAVIPMLRTALVPLTDPSVNYDLRYWTERILAELPAEA